jgi:SAM-dependent methyltransferase
MATAAGDGQGFQASPDEMRAIWESNARTWALRSWPRRPSPDDVATYRRLAGPRLSGRTMLLGATPELRDLLSEGSAPVVVDSSAAMYAATTELLRTADAALETWVQADWRELPFEPRSFDLILGDMIWWGLSLTQQREVVAGIARVLAPDGLFVGRLRCTDRARSREDPTEAVRGFLARIDAAPGDAANVQGPMLAWLYDHTERADAHRLDRERTRALLLELAERPEFERHRTFLRDAASLVIGADWTSQTREELLELFATELELVAEEHAGDYDSRLQPVVALRPRAGKR